MSLSDILLSIIQGGVGFFRSRCYYRRGSDEQFNKLRSFIFQHEVLSGISHSSPRLFGSILVSRKIRWKCDWESSPESLQPPPCSCNLPVGTMEGCPCTVCSKGLIGRDGRGRSRAPVLTPSFLAG